MGRPVRLFEISVIHGYFADPASCRLAFVPDRSTIAWASRVDGAFRGSANRISVYCDSDRAPGGARASGLPATLRFDVYPEDPLFGNFTAPWPMPANIDAPETRAAPVFALAPTLADDAIPHDAAVFSLAASASSGRSSPPAFSIEIEVPAEALEPPHYRIALKPRSVIWTYLLDNLAWNAEDPCIVSADASSAAAPQAEAFVRGDQVMLANGRDAIVLQSSSALPLADRGKRMELWSQRGGRPGRRLLWSLPLPSPADLARTGGAGTPHMCEILVQSLK
jgi:hypothetical protein